METVHALFTSVDVTSNIVFGNAMAFSAGIE